MRQGPLGNFIGKIEKYSFKMWLSMEIYIFGYIKPVELFNQNLHKSARRHVITMLEIQTVEENG